MTKKEFIRFLSYGSGRVVIWFCYLGAAVMPLSLLYAFARFMGRVGYRFASHHRRIALESLTMAFGAEKSKAQIEGIAQGCFDTMASSAVEFFMFMRYPQRIREFVTIEGREHLDLALKKGCGVVALSAHFGSFPLLLSRLALGGYKVHSVLRRMRDVGLDKLFEKMRDRMGVGSIYTQPREACVNLSLKSLRANEIVFVQLDQNFGTGGVFVDFFGTKAATATGPIIFSLRTGAPIVPMFIHRIDGPRHKIVIFPPIELKAKGDMDKVLLDAVQEFTTLIEKYIRKYPHEWGWIHKRWKARPKKEKS
jgi:KDO2-lipid IV(A) lauroyltransferase